MPAFCDLGAEPLKETDQVGMAPIAVARQPHHLPGGAVDRQRGAAGETARWNRSRPRATGPAVGIDLAAEQLLGRRLRDRPGWASGGSGCGIERAQVLRRPRRSRRRARGREPSSKRVCASVRFVPHRGRLWSKKIAVPRTNCANGNSHEVIGADAGRNALRCANPEPLEGTDAMHSRLAFTCALVAAFARGNGGRIHGQDRAAERACVFAGRHHRGRAHRLARGPDRAAGRPGPRPLRQFRRPGPAGFPFDGPDARKRPAAASPISSP